MKKFLVVAGLVFATGCGSKADNALGEMEGYKDKMCACKDKACGDGVMKDMTESTKNMKKDIKKEDVSAEQMKKAGEISAAMMKCYTDLK